MDNKKTETKQAPAPAPGLTVYAEFEYSGAQFKPGDRFYPERFGLVADPAFDKMRNTAVSPKHRGRERGRAFVDEAGNRAILPVRE